VRRSAYCRWATNTSNTSHVQQICLFLLTESRHFPARLLQSSPADAKRRGPEGKFAIIDLDLSKYDRLASRFGKEQKEARTFLKSGIATRNEHFNQLIEQIEHVSINAKDPVLLTGPTGAGKSQLARRYPPGEPTWAHHCTCAGWRDGTIEKRLGHPASRR